MMHEHMLCDILREKYKYDKKCNTAKKIKIKRQKMLYRYLYKGCPYIIGQEENQQAKCN